MASRGQGRLRSHGHWSQGSAVTQSSGSPSVLATLLLPLGPWGWQAVTWEPLCRAVAVCPPCVTLAGSLSLPPLTCGVGLTGNHLGGLS